MLTVRKLSVFVAGVVLIGASSLIAGEITGTVTYEGKVPQFKAVNMNADPVCASHHSEPVYPNVLVLGEGNTLANVLVFVENAPAGTYPAPAEPVVLDQQGCRYNPHVFGIQVGQELKILNPDGTLHNVHAMPKVNAEFNMAMPKFRKVAVKQFESKEVEAFPIKCDVHPWMACWVKVFDHPFFAVTGEDGSFSLKDLPAGEYEVKAWHEKLGYQSAKVTVKDGAEKVEFTFARPA